MVKGYQKVNTCRIMKIPNGIYGKVFYEVGCKKRSRDFSSDTTTLNQARKVAKKMAKKHNIKKIYEEI
jgi:hypothetical protein